MEKIKRNKYAYLVVAGTEAYNHTKRKWEKLPSDVRITNVAKHCGHVRFSAFDAIWAVSNEFVKKEVLAEDLRCSGLGGVV